MPDYVRVSTGAVLDVSTRTFIEASRAWGAADLRILGRHVVPNILAPVIVLGTLGLGNALLIAATLSFLALGAQPPTPEWGAMLSQGREFIFGYWWIATFPGVAILLAAVGANLLREGMRDLLDPRLRVWPRAPADAYRRPPPDARHRHALGPATGRGGVLGEGAALRPRRLRRGV